MASSDQAQPQRKITNRPLTAREKQLATKLGFDEKVLAQVVSSLDPEMGIVSALMNGEFNKPRESESKTDTAAPDVFRGTDVMVAPLLDKDLKNYRLIESQYPELKDLVEREIALRQNPEMLKALPSIGEKIVVSEAQAKALGWRNHSKPKLVIGLRYKCEGNPMFGADNRLSILQGALADSEYRISAVGRNKFEAKSFETRSESEKYLSDFGITRTDPIVLTEQPAKIFEESYPIDFNSSHEQSAPIIFKGNMPIAQPPELLSKVMQAMPGAGLRILPGTTVKELGDKRWAFNQPERFEARAPIMNAMLMKMPKGDFGLDLIRAEGTNAINYSLDTKDIIAKLKDWNTKYSISVLSATYESITIKFKNLPSDLNPLLSEAIAFDPDLNDCGSEEQAKEVLAEELKRTGTISFWWD